MNKKDLSERDICSKFIGPAVKRAGWDGMMQIREEVAFTKGRERADNVRKRNVFTKYGPQARAVLEALLQEYQDQGVIDLGDTRILQIPPLDTMGTPVQFIKEFGTRADFMFAVQELQSALYQKEA
jgi:type I site-specific restriction endonuclease